MWTERFFRGVPPIFEVLDMLTPDVQKRIQERIDWWNRFLFRWYFLTGEL